MSFNPKEHFATCVGGVLDQCYIQDGKYYDQEGNEVDANRKPVAEPTKKKAVPTKVVEESQARAQANE